MRENDLMVVDVESVGERLRLGTPRRLFTREDSGVRLSFDWPDGFSVAPDTQRFVMLQAGESEEADARGPSITLVENWMAEFPGR